MNKNVMLVLVALVAVGIMLASGVGAQLMNGPNGPFAPVPPKVPDKAPAASDEVCEALADAVIAEMEALGGEPMAKEDVIKVLRDAEAEGVNIGDAEIPDTGMSTSDWGATYYPIYPDEEHMHVFLMPVSPCISNIRAGLLWDESDNDLDLTATACNGWDWSMDVGTLTEEVCVTPMYCGPFVWVYVWVNHYGSSCPCNPDVCPTCQYYMIAVDDNSCCFIDCCDDC